MQLFIGSSGDNLLKNSWRAIMINNMQPLINWRLIWNTVKLQKNFFPKQRKFNIENEKSSLFVWFFFAC